MPRALQKFWEYLRNFWCIPNNLEHVLEFNTPSHMYKMGFNKVHRMQKVVSTIHCNLQKGFLEGGSE